MTKLTLLLALALACACKSSGPETHTTPSATFSLFNGVDLSGWHADVPAADDDPSVSPSFVARDGVLVSLGSPGGHLITDETYRDYRLVVEYRWAGEPGNCGVLVHASTPRRLYGMFPQSLEVQMHAGNAGDFWCIGEDITVPAMEERRGPKEKWGVDGDRARRIRNLTDDSEHPPGEWNEMVIECRGRSIDVWVNGELVNNGFDCTADHGRIAIQAEGAVAEFRKLELTPLEPVPETAHTAHSSETPRLFAPGIVSTRAPEFATTFSPDGREAYFNRVDDGRIRILRSTWSDGSWSRPEPLPFSDGTFRDVDPFVDPSGELLYFTADRAEEGSEPEEDFDIWVARRPTSSLSGSRADRDRTDQDRTEWSAPERLPSPPNSPASEAFVSATRDGTLYFGSTNTPDGTRRILRCVLADGEYGPVEEVDLGLEAGQAAGNPLVLPDESALIFTSRDLPGAGAVDLFVSYRAEGGSWSAPRALPEPINSAYADFAPGLGADRASLFFTSERPGIVGANEVEGRPPGDLYFVRIPARAE